MTDAGLPSDGTLFDGTLLTDPHAGYAHLRTACPVVRTTTPDGAPVWLVTRYEDVRAGLADPRLSLSKATSTSSGTHGASMPSALDAHLLNMDPPDHTRVRRLVAPAFTARSVARLRPAIERRTAELLDRFQGGSADVMGDFATPLALTVICDVLGIAEEDRRDFRTWTDALRSPAPDAALASRRALKDMHRYLVGLIAGKRERPGDDLLTQMVSAHEDGDRLSEPELVALAFLLLFAGYDNSANLVGNAVLALLTHEEALTALRSGGLAVGRVVDEVMRWNSPSMLASRRFAREDLDIGGVRIATGERIWMSLTSANRDPQQFDDPGRFDPGRFDPGRFDPARHDAGRFDPARHDAGRPEGGHLGFGHGIHHCLGSALARLEAGIAVEALVRRFPSLRAADPDAAVTWCESFRNRGPLALPVTW
ncbi:cytochrome P450 [Kitasatospora sp. NPDC059747]|uniref:cytochrome P450 family protein n=1 Tax=Kitasatospora sp. NPDC059747 TaxID=3346930 RepID=UPI0036690976